MKIKLLLLYTFFVIYSNGQSYVTWLPDSTLRWQSDTITHNWKLFNKNAFEYDANNNLLNNQIYSRSGNVWYSFARYHYTYDSSSNQTSYGEQRLNFGVWKDKELTSYTYDNHHHMTQQYYDYCPGDTFCAIRYFYDYTYDTIGNLQTTTYHFWNYTNDIWQTDELHSFTYNANNKLMKESVQKWNGALWEDWVQTIYSYDANGNDTLRILQSLQGLIWKDDYAYASTFDVRGNRLSKMDINIIDTIWENTSLTTWTYDTVDNMTGLTEIFWNGNYWQNNTRALWTYDAHNNKTSETFIDGSDTLWTNVYRYLWAYDANKIKQYQLLQDWKINGWRNEDSTHYYYPAAVGIAETGAIGSVLLYPNPTHNNFTLLLPEAKLYQLEIYNTVGEKMYAASINKKQETINCNQLAAGVYIIKLSDKEREYVQKLVIR